MDMTRKASTINCIVRFCRVSPKSLDPEANTEMITNAQIDGLGGHNHCVYAEFDLLLFVLKLSWI